MGYQNRYRRQSSGRSLRKVFLIVCEGKKTEPNYFQSFPYDTEKYFVKVYGAGCNTLSLVRKAMEAIAEAKKARQKYEQVWCVFDKDEFTDSAFNAAVEAAKARDIRCAYSNESFELWYVLHFEYWQTASARQEYCAKLDMLLALSGGYSKTSGYMYALLKEKQHIALRNARKLCETYPNGLTPAAKNPVTMVFQLVELLNTLV